MRVALNVTSPSSSDQSPNPGGSAIRPRASSTASSTAPNTGQPRKNPPTAHQSGTRPNIAVSGHSGRARTRSSPGPPGTALPGTALPGTALVGTAVRDTAVSDT